MPGVTGWDRRAARLAPIGERSMSNKGWSWTLVIAGAVLALGATLPAEADEQKPYRVRGTLESVESNRLTVNTREGEMLDLTLNDDSRVMVVRPAGLDDIKQGDYVGLTSIDSDGKRVAISVHIFAEDLRGTAEGHGPWDLVEEPNTMTNGRRDRGSGQSARA
jgi:hypothetical protein